MKRFIVVLLLAVLLSGFVFSQEKHQPGDMLIGGNLGLAMTPKLFSAFTNPDHVTRGDYAFTFDLGLSFDYYLFGWLSFSSGLFYHTGIYALLKDDFYSGGTFELSDYFKTPNCFTIPLSAHVNVPNLEWLYLGLGFTFNFPVSSILDSDYPQFDTKGKFFVGLPIDFGFDLIKPGRGGSRFFFRVTPEFHSGGTPVLVGIMWQIFNIKVH